MGKPLIFFDLETGGMEWWTHWFNNQWLGMKPVIQIAMMAVDRNNGGVLDEYEARIKFDPAFCEPEALEINHYDPEVWRATAKPAKQVLKEINNWARPYGVFEKISKNNKPYRLGELAGHNAARFDINMLRRMYELCDEFFPFDNRVHDTMQLALTYQAVTDKQFADLKQTTIAERLGVNIEDAHNAIDDVHVCAQIWHRMIYELRVRPQWPETVSGEDMDIFCAAGGFKLKDSDLPF
jgi:DNA polymerase III epsilon subunit-like protein